MSNDLIAYQKPFLNGEQLCDKLIEQGLQIDNRELAAKTMERLSYYRFKAYLFPFQDENKRFYEDSTFDDAYQLYCFDSELRNYLFSIIEKVEVGIRASLDQWVVEKSGNRYWYLDSSLFTHQGEQIKTVNRIRDSFVDSKEKFAKHFRKKYYNEYSPFYRDLPPSWVAIELMTFGNLSKLVNTFNPNAREELKLNRYADKKCGVKNFQALTTWISVIHEVRNCCGHHGRLFNRNLQSPTGIKRYLSSDVSLIQRTDSHESQLNRLYTAVAALQIIYNGLGYEDKIGNRIAEFFDRYPSAKRFHASMGFPEGWKNERLLYQPSSDDIESGLLLWFRKLFIRR